MVHYYSDTICKFDRYPASLSTLELFLKASGHVGRWAPSMEGLTVNPLHMESAQALTTLIITIKIEFILKNIWRGIV